MVITEQAGRIKDDTQQTANTGLGEIIFATGKQSVEGRKKASRVKFKEMGRLVFSFALLGYIWISGTGSAFNCCKNNYRQPWYR